MGKSRRSRASPKHSKFIRCECCDFTFSQKKAYTKHAKSTPHLEQLEKAACKICGDQLTTLNDLYIHKQLHNEDSHCNFCKLKFEDYSQFETHIKEQLSTIGLCNYVTEKNPEVNFSCDKCSETFSHKSSLHIHNLVHGNSMNCAICDTNFENLDIFKQHIFDHVRKRKEIKCAICLKTLRSESILKKHLRVHTNERPFKCEICGKCFKTKGSFTYHEKIHDESKRMSQSLFCEICNGVYTNTSTLNKHIRKVHTKNNESQINYKCLLCDEIFVNKLSLSIHVISHNASSSSSNSFFCLICSATFETQEKLEEHKENNHFEYLDRTFVCLVCNKIRFFYKPDIDYHMNFEHYSLIQCPSCDQKMSYFAYKKHITKHSSLTCEICGKISENKDLHLKHELQHKEFDFGSKVPLWLQRKLPSEINYECKICKRPFRSKHFYEKHLKKHENPISCTKCKKTFSTQKSLDAHEITHPENRYLECRFCSSLKYKNMKLLLRHFTENHKDEKPLFCTVCDKGFDILSDFRDHVGQEHRRKWRYKTTFPLNKPALENIGIIKNVRDRPEYVQVNTIETKSDTESTKDNLESMEDIKNINIKCEVDIDNEHVNYIDDVMNVDCKIENTSIKEEFDCL